MSQQQVATNHAAVRALAATMETAAGHEIPDVLAIAGRAAAELIGNGYRRVEPIPARGNGGSDQARAEALAATAAAVAAAKNRTGGSSTPAASPRQLTKLAILLAEDGVREREERLAWCSAMVNRPLATSGELTRDEAHHLIETLEVPPPAEAPPTAVDNAVDEPTPPDPDVPVLDDDGLDQHGDSPLADEQPPEPDSWVIDDSDWTPAYAEEPLY